MWITIIILILLGIALGAVQFGFVPPRDPETLIRIRNGGLFFLGQDVKPHAKMSVLEIIRESRVENGFIAITPGRRVKFSRSIPQAIHQRLRNVLLNQ
jgi:hypothetical protein